MNALAIAWTDLKRLFRERAALFWIFVGPVIFTTFFGILFKPQPDRPTVVTIVNRDATDRVAGKMAGLLQRDKLVVRRSDRAPEEGWAVEIPSGTGAALAAAKPVSVILHTSEEESTAELSLRFTVQKALTAIFIEGGVAEVAGTRQGATPDSSPAEAVRIVRSDIGVQRHDMTAGFQRSVPAYLVMFTFLNLLVSGAGLAEERASGRLRRLFIAPVTRRDIILGKLLTRFATGWIQIAYMLGLGVLVFKIRWAEHNWALFGFLTLFALASASLGMLYGTLFKDPDKCASAAVWTAVLLSPLGGCWWPLEVVGTTMRKIGYMVPTGWAMEAVNALLAFGAGARDVAPFALAFTAMTVICLTLAARRLTP